MPVAYWDPENGDDANPGTAGAPVATLNRAVTLAGSGGEVRAAGRQLQSLGMATWTDYSTTVEFESAPPLSAGDVIMPAGGYPHAVSSVDGTTVTLACPAWVTGQPGEQQAVETFLVPQITIAARQDAPYGYSDLLYTFGWDLSTESQPDGWVTCIAGAGLLYWLVTINGSHNTLVAADGRFILYCSDGSNLNNGLVRFDDFDGRIRGAVMCVRSSRRDPAVGFLRGSCAYADEIIAVNCSSAVTVDQGWAVVEKIVAVHANCVVAGGTGGRIRIGRFEGRENDWSTISAWAGKGQHITIDEFDWRHGQINLYGQFGCLYEVRRVAGVTPGTTSTPVNIAAPVDAWRSQRITGTVEKVYGGRGGDTDLCVRFDPSDRYMPVDCPLRVPNVSNGTLTLQFYARYTGSSAPTCWVECQGQRYEFSPQQADAWADDQLVTLELSVAGNSSELEIVIYATDNSQGDALIYLDDISLQQGGQQSTVNLEAEAFGLLADPNPPPPQYRLPLQGSIVQQRLTATVRQ